MQTPLTRLYYGWVVVALAFITLMFVIGTFISSGVLFAALIAEFGWSHATTALPFSVALVGYAATAWLAGRLFDRYGPRRLFPLGAICLGLGLIMSSYAQTTWHLCLTWGVLVSQGFNLAGFVPNIALVSLWFHRKRGIASGIAISGASLGGLAIVPGIQYLVDDIGWRQAYALLGVITMVCLVPLNALWQRHYPSDLGLYPDGDTASFRASHQTTSTLASPWTLGLALQTPRFWFLFIMVMSIGWLSNLTSVHFIAHIQDNGFSSLTAASAIGFMGFLRGSSGAIWGGLSDRFGREWIYTWGTGFCFVGLTGLAWMVTPHATWLLYGSILIYGIGNGAHGAVEASATADLFHGPHLGAILGALELGWGLGGFAGSSIGGFWRDTWHTYNGIFLVTNGLITIGCLALWWAAPRRPMPYIPKTVE